MAGTEFERAAQAHGVRPALLYALAVARSGQVDALGRVAPWPWTVIERGQPHYYQDRPHAAQALLAPEFGPVQNTRDVGLTGINSTHLGTRGAAASDLLDPATNLRLAAAILADGLRATPHDPALAIGRVAYPTDARAARALGQQVQGIATALGAAPSGAPAPRIGCRVPPPVPAAPVAAGRGPAAAAQRPSVVDLIKTAAARHGVDPAFALAIAKNESGFRQSALSPKGARGVMQLMPGTAARYGADPHDLGQNIEAGVRYLRDLADLFGGDAALVAAAYNAGEHAVVKHGWRVPPYRETQAYVPRVLAAREHLWSQP
ncbi:lytic transglycosylase domain-containing protein [Candidatus Thiodictyon syntrophicum]|uniref:lytic transglycosylase domain-containing protein n=1 Tax=Candidatus Thiodictyon syntrophicum TaxID=1166950 RepID=UPI001F41DE5F|nr:transglycosylase SLT domain-containing protein [Candidatus Thiodictyon syntrophicum]